MGAANDISIRLSARQTVAWEALEESPDVTEVFYGGAAGGGKSWLGCQWQIYRRLRHPGTRGALCRDELKKLKLTTLRTFMDCWTASWQHFGVSMNYNQQAGVIYFGNGSEIVLLDLHLYPTDPDFHSLGSLELTDAFIDEAPEITQKAFQILSSRIRYRLDSLPVREPKILLAGNPSNNWVKFRYIRDEEGNSISLSAHQSVVSARLADNPDDEFRRIYGKQLAGLSHYDRRRLLDGDWDAVAREGGEAFYSFNPEQHVQDLPFLPDLPVAHLSFDQNVVPYMTLIAAQCRYAEDNTLEIRVFREYCLKHPRNSTKAVCEAFLVEYGDRVQEVFFYGDASGNKRDTRAALSDYDIAAATLRSKISARSNRVQRSNPEVRKRVLFLCSIFEGKVPSVRLIVDRNCHNLINDLLYVKQDANGGKVKAKASENGVSFERYGHCFTGDTMVTTIYGQKRIDAISVGDLVLTRKGWRPVERVFYNGEKPVQEYSINGTQISCTSDHLFYTENQGFKPVSDLEIGDEICIFDSKSSQICKEKLSTLTVSNSQGIQIRKKGNCAFTMPDGLLLMASGLKCAFINTFGFLLLGQYRANTISTTKTTTRSITIYQTLSAFRDQSMRPGIQNRSGKLSEIQGFHRLTKRQDRRLLHGTKAMQAEHGMLSKVEKVFSGQQSDTIAKTVSNPLKRTLLHTQTFAQKNATPHSTSEFTEPKKGSILTQTVRYAGAFLKNQNGVKPYVAQEHADFNTKKVYDLRVQGEHEYFANGVLVHNCSDALEYMLTKVCEQQFQAFAKILQ